MIVAERQVSVVRTWHDRLLRDSNAPSEDVRVSDLAIGQIAFNHLGGCRLWEWYRDGFGLIPSGATLFGGPPAAKVNGLPAPLFPGHWLMDGRDWFQFEFFRFLHPRPKPRRSDETAADLGYRRVGLYVPGFDATLARLHTMGSRPVGPVLGGAGSRRACVRDGAEERDPPVHRRRRT
jgi:hypothetical protein